MKEMKPGETKNFFLTIYLRQHGTSEITIFKKINNLCIHIYVSIYTFIFMFVYLCYIFITYHHTSVCVVVD